jgi:hypothetical protein
LNPSKFSELCSDQGQTALQNNTSEVALTQWFGSVDGEMPRLDTNRQEGRLSGVFLKIAIPVAKKEASSSSPLSAAKCIAVVPSGRLLGVRVMGKRSAFWGVHLSW